LFSGQYIPEGQHEENIEGRPESMKFSLRRNGAERAFEQFPTALPRFGRSKLRLSLVAEVQYDAGESNNARNECSYKIPQKRKSV
jgi:hypothetical protein